MKYLHDNNINAYIPDNQFRSRDPKFSKQKKKYGKRHQDKKSQSKKRFSASEFSFDQKTKICTCPEGKTMGFLQETKKKTKNRKIFFEGKLTDCRHCKSKHRCMRNPESADTRLGHGRQVSFIIGKKDRMSVVDRLLLLHNLHFRHPWRSTCFWQYWF